MTPKKYPQNLHTQKIFIFLKTPKNIEIQNFEPKKMGRAYVCVKIPPLGHGLRQIRKIQTLKITFLLKYLTTFVCSSADIVLYIY